uniref:Uncharacterized protein n=1 Tax=Oryza rufipogon TaxID=4529 RepID=A0A0E0QNJ0_ORYRU
MAAAATTTETHGRATAAAADGAAPGQTRYRRCCRRADTLPPVPSTEPTTCLGVCRREEERRKGEEADVDSLICGVHVGPTLTQPPRRIKPGSKPPRNLKRTIYMSRFISININVRNARMTYIVKRRE